MIFTPNGIYTKVENDLNADNTVYCSRTFIPSPEEFPYCYMTEISRRDVLENVTLKHDSSVKRITWEVQVWSNKEFSSVAEADKVMRLVEQSFSEMAFIETMCGEMPYSDKQIYRLVARFERVIGGADEID